MTIYMYNIPFHENHTTKGRNHCVEFRQSGRQWCRQPKPRFQFNPISTGLFYLVVSTGGKGVPPHSIKFDRDILEH